MASIIARVLGACFAAMCAFIACFAIACSLYVVLYWVIVPTKLHTFPAHFVVDRCVDAAQTP